MRISCFAQPGARPSQLRNISHNLTTQNNQASITQEVCCSIPEKRHLPVEHGQKLRLGRFFEKHRIVADHQPLGRWNRFRTMVGEHEGDSRVRGR